MELTIRASPIEASTRYYRRLEPARNAASLDQSRPGRRFFRGFDLIGLHCNRRLLAWFVESRGGDQLIPLDDHSAVIETASIQYAQAAGRSVIPKRFDGMGMETSMIWLTGTEWKPSHPIAATVRADEYRQMRRPPPAVARPCTVNRTRDPAPAAAPVNPATVVIGNPAPALVGNPPPAVGGIPVPAAVAIGRPIRPDSAGRPDRTIIRAVYPLSIIIQIIDAWNGLRKLAGVSFYLPAQFLIPRLVPAVPIILILQFRHLKVVFIGSIGALDHETSPLLDRDGAYFLIEDFSLAAPDYHLGGAVCAYIDAIIPFFE